MATETIWCLLTEKLFLKFLYIYFFISFSDMYTKQGKGAIVLIVLQE